jgi:hypothetical protein
MCIDMLYVYIYIYYMVYIYIYTVILNTHNIKP